MPQHAMGDTHFLSLPKHLFTSTSSATDSGCDTPPSSRASPASLRSAHGTLGSSSQPLFEPQAEKRSSQTAREVQYVSSGPQNSLCGWQAFTPKCLQVFNTPKGFLFFLCAASFLQGMTVNGFINTVITLAISPRLDSYFLAQGSTSMDFCLKNLSMTYTSLI